MSSSAADADRLYASLRAALEPAGPERVGSETSAELWIHAALLGIAPAGPVDEHDAEILAERVARGRLERYMQDVAPFLGDHGDVLLGDLHVRPMRSGLHAAFTLPLTSGGLIVVDDATHDLTHSAATLMMAAWGPPPEQEPSGEARSLPFYDSVRLLRLQLGALRWGGKLWQPIDVRLPEADRGTAATLSTWAVQFILAHEVGHLALGHVASGGSLPRRTASEELAADAFAARALRRMVRAGHRDADEVHADLDALVARRDPARARRGARGEHHLPRHRRRPPLDCGTHGVPRGRRDARPLAAAARTARRDPVSGGRVSGALVRPVVGGAGRRATEPVVRGAVPAGGCREDAGTRQVGTHHPGAASDAAVCARRRGRRRGRRGAAAGGARRRAASR